MDTEERAQDLVDTVLEFLEDAPIDLTPLIYHDELYEACYAEVMSKLADEADFRRDELKDYNE